MVLKLKENFLAYDLYAFLQSKRRLIPDPPEDPAWRNKLLERPPPNLRDTVMFTPRSGSSRLTELARASGALGNPGEEFNPRFVPEMAGKFAARDLRDYVTVLERAKSENGVFGAEATYLHIKSVFGSFQRYLDVARPDGFCWLLREDIVAQAVSAARMVQTKVAHATLSSDLRFRISVASAASLVFQFRPTLGQYDCLLRD